MSKYTHEHYTECNCGKDCDLYDSTLSEPCDCSDCRSSDKSITDSCRCEDSISDNSCRCNCKDIVQELRNRKEPSPLQKEVELLLEKKQILPEIAPQEVSNVLTPVNDQVGDNEVLIMAPIETSSKSDKSTKSPVEISSKSDKSTKSTKIGKLVISFNNKEGHPLQHYNSGNTSIKVNGKNGPVIHLHRDHSYFFCIDQETPEPEDFKHAFILTTSPVGGPKSEIIPGGFDPVSKGCVCLEVNNLTPRYFYYQDFTNEFSGGLIIVHDE